MARRSSEPTVQNLGQTGSVWTDHTDIRPTMLSILGLQSDYVQDGRALTELMNPSSVPSARVRAPDRVPGPRRRLQAARRRRRASSATTPSSSRRRPPRACPRVTRSRRASTSSSSPARPSATRSPRRSAIHAGRRGVQRRLDQRQPGAVDDRPGRQPDREHAHAVADGRAAELHRVRHESGSRARLGRRVTPALRALPAPPEHRAALVRRATRAQGSKGPAFRARAQGPNRATAARRRAHLPHLGPWTDDHRHLHPGRSGARRAPSPRRAGDGGDQPRSPGVRLRHGIAASPRAPFTCAPPRALRAEHRDQGLPARDGADPGALNASAAMEPPGRSADAGASRNRSEADQPSKRVAGRMVRIACATRPGCRRSAGSPPRSRPAPRTQSRSCTSTAPGPAGDRAPGGDVGWRRCSPQRPDGCAPRAPSGAARCELRFALV